MGSAIRIGGLGPLLLVGTLWAAACDSGGTTDTPDAATVVVRVLLDGEGEAGVPVRLYPGTSTTATATATTGSDGRASFTGLTAGPYEAEIEVPTGAELAAGEEARKAVSAVEGASRELAFDLVTSSSGGDVVEVAASGVSFTPSELTIEPGTTVRWRNGDGVTHTVTPDGHSEWSEATLGSSGAEFEHTFNTPGDFPYYCVPHRGSGMTGSITVQ
ncbi:MAG: plastocyanin/azurin family copper-binding protein [Gemmatimonadota bacterium]